MLEIGCGTGDTLASLQPSVGVGVDFSPAMVAQAREAHPHLEFHIGDAEDPAVIAGLFGSFDVILIVDTLGFAEDVQALLERLHRLCSRETRLVVAYYSHLWQPWLRVAEAVGLRMRQPAANVLSPADLRALAELADFDPVKSESRLVSPFRLLGIGRLLNRFVSPLPVIRHLSLRHYMVARSARHVDDGVRSATVVVPARNERGNVEPAVCRIPSFCDDIEIVFVEGPSKDGTYEEVERVKAAYPDRDIS